MATLNNAVETTRATAAAAVTLKDAATTVAIEGAFNRLYTG